MDVLLMTKVKNVVKKAFGSNVEFKLHNIDINGCKRGCSGFIRNPENNVTVYINTEKSSLPLPYGYLIRYAKDFSDYTGCRNRMQNHSLETLVNEVCDMLRNPAGWERELVSWNKV